MTRVKDFDGTVGNRWNDLLPLKVRKGRIRGFPHFVINPGLQLGCCHQLQFRPPFTGTTANGFRIQTVMGKGVGERLPGGGMHLQELVPQEEEHGSPAGENLFSLPHGQGPRNRSRTHSLAHDVDFQAAQPPGLEDLPQEERGLHSHGVPRSVNQTLVVQPDVDGCGFERVKGFIAQGEKDPRVMKDFLPAVSVASIHSMRSAGSGSSHGGMECSHL